MTGLVNANKDFLNEHTVTWRQSTSLSCSPFQSKYTSKLENVVTNAPAANVSGYLPWPQRLQPQTPIPTHQRNSDYRRLYSSIPIFSPFEPALVPAITVGSWKRSPHPATSASNVASLVAPDPSVNIHFM
ncbi:hypothetical protein PMIN04_004392 [Paraphaeosphaeria minitans]